MKKNRLMIVLFMLLFTAFLLMPPYAFQDPLECASLTGCGDWSECPDRGYEIQFCVLDCDDGPIVFCYIDP